MALGAAMVIVPFLASAVGIFRASGVPEGLRGATHLPAMKGKVSFALGSASLMALLAPPGILIGVLCGLSFVESRRPTRRDPDEVTTERPPGG